ncbi:MAG: hypothetical protein V1897_18935 [Pseudomonadota bacterium]
MKTMAKMWPMAVVLTLLVCPVAGAQIIWDQPGAIPSFSSQPTVFVGYLTPNKSTTFSLGNSASNTFNIRSLEQTLNIQGIWTEFSLPVKSSGPLGLVLDFGYLFPINRQSEETYNLNASGFASRTWDTSSQLWNLSVAITYHFLPSVTGVLGFRYESFMTNYTDYYNEVPKTLDFNPNALAGTDFNFSGYIPFFGAVVDGSLGSAACFKIGAIGFPALPGSFVYNEVIGSQNPTYTNDSNGIKTSNEFSSGYFLEAFGEVSRPINWWARLGAFIKYNGVWGRATMDVNTNVWELDKMQHNQAVATFQRSSWIFGGSVSASF